MKSIFTVIFVFLVASCASTNTDLPLGTIQKGSLSNRKLINDAMQGVTFKMIGLGCSKPESFEPYVVSMPSGEIGARIWSELWVVKGCGTEYKIYVNFSEDGMNAANYTVE